MNWIVSLAVLVGLVAVTTGLGLVWKSRTGRVRHVAVAAQATRGITPADVGSERPFGELATLLQFSTEFCAPCRSTSVLLGDLARTRPQVAHVEVDLTDQPDLARRFNVMQTPTTLLLDASGSIRARIGGAPRREELRARLDDLLEGNRVKLS